MLVLYGHGHSPTPPAPVPTKSNPKPLNHVSLPSLDALALLGLCALAHFLATHLLASHPTHHAQHHGAHHIPTHPLFSVLAPITQMPGASVTFYLLPCWRSVGALVPGNDAMTTHPLAALSPDAAAVGLWVVWLLEASKALAVLLPLLAAVRPRLSGRGSRKRGGGGKKEGARWLAAVGRPCLGALVCLLGGLLALLPLYCLPSLLARDIAENPVDHPLLLGVSPQEVVFRFVYWDDPERIDDPNITTIFRYVEWVRLG